MDSGKQAAGAARRSFGLLSTHSISLLIATALVAVSLFAAVATLIIAPLPAMAADGDGGTGAPNPPPPGGAGGAGQSGFMGTDGGDGQDNIFAGGGGGGGSSGTTAGGNGGNGGMSILGGSGAGGPGGTGIGGAGGPGGNDTNADAGGGGGGGGSTAGNGASGTIAANSAGGAGGAGGFGSSGNLQGGGGGGGGGGGYGAIITTNANNTFTVMGGNGGNGGAGGTVCTVVDCTGQSLLGAGNGGNGGAGGVGVQLNSPVTTFTNSGNITGGAGGGGGDGGGAPGLPLSFNGNGGNGGTGGAGIAGSGITITNNATFGITGGNGGTAGAAGSGAAGAGSAGFAGAGGAGIVGSGLTVINSGTITGGLSGDGVTRANAITFTGGSNFLNLNPSGTQGTLTGNIDVTGSLTFNQPNTVSLSNAITGSGSITQIGTGTLTLAGASTYSGPTNVNAGILNVNGSLASTVFVNSGATLMGTGTIGGLNVGSGGTFAPGNSPGTMTVAGNLAFQSGALYLVQVNPSTASSTNVTAGGSATLAGTVQAAFASGSYVSRTYTILSAAVGLNGTTFNTLTTSNLPSGFTANLSYTNSDVILNLTANLGAGPSALVTGGLSENQRNVAGALNSFFNSGGALPPPFVSIFGLTGGSLANALSQLSGEAGTGAQKVAFQLTDQFLNLMLDPFVDGRSGVGGADHPALGFAPERDSTPPEIALAYASVFKAPQKALPPVYEPRWTAWGGAYGGSNRTSGDLAVIGSHDVSARTVGVAGGLDYRLTPDTVVGLAFAGGGTNWSLSQGLGGGKSDAFQAGIYGATKNGPAYLAASFAFANHWMSTNRLAFGDHLTADFNAQSYGGRLEGGYRFATPFAGITPYAAIQAQSFHAPGYTESGVIPNGFALTFNGRDATDTRSELGARFDRALAVYSNAVLALRGRVAWAHDWVSDPSLTPLFQALPGASFIVNGALLPQNAALASAGGEIRFGNGITLLAKFDGEFASHSSTYGGTGTFRYRW
jgi:uncharacterized protein with beta-barrel porin domain